MIVGVGGVVVILAGVNVPLRLAETWWPSGQTLDSNWFSVVIKVVKGHTQWTPPATWVAGGMLGVLLCGLAAGLIMYRSWNRRTSRLDWCAEYMGWGDEILPITADHAEKMAHQLGVKALPPSPTLDHMTRSMNGYTFSGTGIPRAVVTVITLDTEVASTVCDEKGQWMATVNGRLPAGTSVMVVHAATNDKPESLASSAIRAERVRVLPRPSTRKSTTMTAAVLNGTFRVGGHI
jgi:hypothetical protein